ncbi:DNA-binding protein [Neptuniibacter sp.]|uniref:DNA-binding protein n=1 Tax=Neptuniibacter sp. TaxID=1962643 RepID=UPI003B59EF10
MSNNVTEVNVFDTADRLLMAGVKPTSELISQSLGGDAEETEQLLNDWWARVPERLSLAVKEFSIPDIPDPLAKSFSVIWQQAVQEANSFHLQERKTQAVGVDEVKREADENLQQSKGRLIELEDRLRKQQQIHEDVLSQVKGLEAEVKVLKTSLAGETSQRKTEEQARLNVEQELTLLRKTHDDSKRVFDQRIKDEQRRGLDEVSKADADVRYYRGALEKLRDEVGKKESALTKTIHDLQAEVARKDAKLEAQKTQTKSLETELKELKLNSSGQNRDLSKINNQLLSEANKNKRLEDKVKDLEEDLKRARLKQVSVSTEQSRREAGIRAKYQDKEEELVRALAKVSGLEKKIVTQDEEIRRLNSRI